MKSEEKQLAPPETVSRNARNHLSDEQWRSLREKTLKQANLFNDAYMNLFFEDAIPCVQLMVDKIIGDGYTVEPAPQKGHRLLSDERERTEGRPENDLVADPHEVIVPEQPDQALEC